MNEEYSFTQAIASKFHKSLISRLEDIHVDYYDFYEGEGVFYKPSQMWASISEPMHIANYGSINKYLDCIHMYNGREEMVKSCDTLYFRITFTREFIEEKLEALLAQLEQQYVPSLLSKFDTLQDKVLFLNNLQVEMHRLEFYAGYDIYIRILVSTMPKKEFYDFMDKYNRKYSGIFYD